MNQSDVHPAAWALCIAMILAVVGCFALAFTDKPIPDLLGLLTGSLVTSSAAMLAKTRRDPEPSGEPTPVEVVNAPQDPVPTTDSDA